MSRGTHEQVRKLASDASSLTAARRLAMGGPWSGTDASESLLWGTCQRSGKTPYQVSIDLRKAVPLVTPPDGRQVSSKGSTRPGLPELAQVWIQAAVHPVAVMRSLPDTGEPEVGFAAVLIRFAVRLTGRQSDVRGVLDVIGVVMLIPMRSCGSATRP